MTPCRQADLAMRDRRFTRARALYEQAAAAGDARAWFGLGWMAEKGYGQPADLPRALDCYQKGAAGDAQSAFNLAAHLAMGAGGEARRAEVLGWYQRALELGHARARARIALVLHDGLGVARDEPRADELCRQAIWEGDSSARAPLTLRRLAHFELDESRYDDRPCAHSRESLPSPSSPCGAALLLKVPSAVPATPMRPVTPA